MSAIVASLLACLLNYLSSDYSDQVNWALCPNSFNCICRNNLTKKSNFAMRCLEMEDSDQWCPSSKVNTTQACTVSAIDVTPPNSLFQIKQQFFQKY